jgi:hypothetical protein
MKMMSLFNFFFNPLTWVKLTTFHLGDDDTPPPQQNTTVTTNIPEYAQGYVENMLGAAQNQLFNTTTDAQGNTTLNGLKPYTPYSTNMNDYVAGFSPLQQQAQTQAAGLNVPGQFAPGTSMATASGLGSLGTATTAAGAGNDYMKMAQDPAAMKNFMNPYLKDTLDPALAELRRQYGITGTQEQSAATGAGAFGGSREALMAAENQRNLGQAQSQMIGSAYDKAFQAAQQAQQYGSNLGLQGQQAALQGYGQAGQAAGTLGSLGSQELAAQQGIIGTQNQIGAQQTAAEQQKINQAIQDYGNAQQYPLMELGVMSNLTRGLPLSAPTTSMYQAQPSAATQMIGSAGAIGSLGAATPRASGGILSVKNFDVGGAVAANLEKLPTEKLQEMAKQAKGIELSEIKQILVDRQMGAVPGMAPGGIVAFKTGDKVMSDEQQQASDAYDKWQQGTDPVRSPDYDYTRSTLNEFGISDMPKADDSKLTLGRSGPVSNPTRDRLMELAGESNVNNGLNWQDQLKKPAAAVAKAPVDDPAARQLAFQLANKKPTPAAGTPTENNQLTLDQIISKLTGPTPKGNDVQAPVDDIDTKLKGIISQQDNLSQIFADGLRDIYVNKPELAPYAKARFDQFQDEIDGAKEKDRQMFWLHSATMFATMATQPGGVIKAAMGALAQEIPLYVKDKEAQEKHMADIKKAQYDITQAEIARRVGDLKTSMELQQNALKVTADIYKEMHTDRREKAKIAEEARGHDMQNRVGMMNATTNAFIAKKDPSELATLKGINADQELKDLYLGKSKQKDIDTAYAAYLKLHEGETDVMKRSQFEQAYYSKDDALKVDDKTVNLVNQYLNNAKK